MPKWHDHELWNTSSDHAAAVTNHLEVAAPGTGKTLIISWFAISVGSPASNICLLDGSGGTVLLEFYLARLTYQQLLQALTALYLTAPSLH